MNLFAYGTLMEPRLLARLIGAWPVPHAATLSGYKRFSFKNESYPGIVPAVAGETVSGIVFIDLNGLAWQHLDNFEGDIYERVAVSVKTESADVLNAQTYVVGDTYRHLLSEHDWDFATFLREDLTAYLSED